MKSVLYERNNDDKKKLVCSFPFDSHVHRYFGVRSSRRPTDVYEVQHQLRL